MQPSWALHAAVLAYLLTAASAGVRAADPVPGLHVDNVYARAMPPGARTAGAYLTIRNGGTGADRLVSARTPRARAVELHTMSEQNGVMRMRAVDAVPVAPGQSVALAPGGLHLMLIAPDPPLKEGEHVPLTLHFEHAGDVNVDLTVQSLTATGAPSLPGTPAMPMH